MRETIDKPMFSVWGIGTFSFYHVSSYEDVGLGVHLVGRTRCRAGCTVFSVGVTPKPVRNSKSRPAQAGVSGCSLDLDVADITRSPSGEETLVQYMCLHVPSTHQSWWNWGRKWRACYCHHRNKKARERSLGNRQALPLSASWGMDFGGTGVPTKQVFTEQPLNPGYSAVNSLDRAPAFVEPVVWWRIQTLNNVATGFAITVVTVEITCVSTRLRCDAWRWYC